MRYALLALVLLRCTGGAAPASGADPSRETGGRGQPPLHFDILIRNGDVIDGTGAPRKQADVGISGDAIARVGDLAHAPGPFAIAARGQVVPPGFINLLGNSRSAVLIDPHLEGK